MPRPILANSKILMHFKIFLHNFASYWTLRNCKSARKRCLRDYIPSSPLPSLPPLRYKTSNNLKYSKGKHSLGKNIHE